MTVHRIAVVTLPGLSVLYLWLSSPAHPLQVSSQALVIAVVHACVRLPAHLFPLHVLPKTSVDLLRFMFSYSAGLSRSCL